MVKKEQFKEAACDGKQRYISGSDAFNSAKVLSRPGNKLTSYH